MNRRLAPVLGLAVLFLAAACGAAGKSAAATPPPSPSPSAARTVPSVAMPSGAIYEVEVARTPEEQAQGLMFRESLREKTGMIFLFPDSAVHRFWMKNTMIPLDMIWMDSAGKVLFVNANTPPCKADPCPNYGPDVPASSVLEIEGGKAAKDGVKAGSVLKFVDVR